MIPANEGTAASYAPTMYECLVKAGVPRFYEEAALNAVRDWIGSWRGLPETPETLLASLAGGRPGGKW
jgi:hypothetical protein